MDKTNLNIECSLFIDDFTNEKTVVVSKVGKCDHQWFNFISSDEILTVKFSMVATEQFLFFKFFTWGPCLKMAKGDEIIFLFEDKSTLTYKFTQGGNNGCNVSRVGLADLLTLSTKTFLKMRVTTRSQQEVFFIYGTGEKGYTFIRDYLEYSSEAEGQNLLKQMAREFLITVEREMPELLLNKVHS